MTAIHVPEFAIIDVDIKFMHYMIYVITKIIMFYEVNV